MPRAFTPTPPLVPSGGKRRGWNSPTKSANLPANTTSGKSDALLVIPVHLQPHVGAPVHLYQTGAGPGRPHVHGVGTHDACHAHVDPIRAPRTWGRPGPAPV